MTQAQTAIERFALANWKNTSRGGNSAVAHDHSAVMQRGFRMENGQREFDGKVGIERHSRFLVDADGSVTFDRDERAKLFVRKLSDGLGDVVDGVALLARSRINWMTAEPGQAG